RGRHNVAAQKLLVAGHIGKEGLDFIQPYARVGSKLIETIHQKRLGQNRKVAKRPIHETLVIAPIEPRICICKPPKPVEGPGLVRFKLNPGPPLPGSEPSKLEARPDQSRYAHPLTCGTSFQLVFLYQMQRTLAESLSTPTRDKLEACPTSDKFSGVFSEPDPMPFPPHGNNYDGKRKDDRSSDGHRPAIPDGFAELGLARGNR